MAPLIVIVGETASGKSQLALELAQKYQGEIICADSRTIYKGMDIGTAKPSKADQNSVKHHLLDIIEPNVRFSAAQFKRMANDAINDINNRGKLPILVGGTGLYVDAVIYDYQFSSDEESARRDPGNPRHLAAPTKQIRELRPATLVIGILTEREQLSNRIHSRNEHMTKQGLKTEVENLAKVYGWESPGMLAVGYREWKEYFIGTGTEGEVLQMIEKNTKDYAKRQRTWFKRNNSIHWIENSSNIDDILTTFLNKSS